MNNTITNLIEELEKIQVLEDKRLGVLILYLYAEHYSIKLIKKHKVSNSFDFVCSCGKKTGSRSLALEERIDKLIDLHILKSEDALPFKLLNLIRNRLIHDLSPNIQKIEEWIKEYSPATSTEYLKNLLNKENSWIKFYISLVAATANMYHVLNSNGPSLEAIEKNIITGRWIFHIKK